VWKPVTSSVGASGRDVTSEPFFCMFQLSRGGVNTVRDPVHLPHVLLHQEDAGQEEEIQSGCEGKIQRLSQFRKTKYLFMFLFVYKARDVIILMRANPFQVPLEGVGPEMATREASAIWAHPFQRPE
jgi:hypothetical protein